MGVVYTVNTKFDAIDKISAKVDRIEKNVSSLGNKAVAAFNRADRASRKLTRSVGKLNKVFGGLGIAMGGAAVFGVAKNFVKTFADFEQANASLASVMAGATRPELNRLQKDAERLGAITAKSATEVVGLQESFARLGFSTGEIIDMTESTINGSVAMQAELDQTATLVGAMVRSFDNLDSINAPSILDAMTTATQKSALNFEKLETSLPIVAGAANAAGVDFNKLLALLGKLSDAGIDASSSATSLRNIFIESAAQGLSYDQILAKIVKEQDKLTAANDEFGKRAAVSGIILAKNLKQTDQLAESLKKEGTAQEAANKQLNTLKGRVTLLGSAWEGFILSIEKGNGPFGTFLKNVVETATELLAIASGTQKAKEELTKHQLVIRQAAEKVIKFLKVMKWLVIAFVAFKVAVLASRAALIASNFIRFVAVFMKIAKAKGIWTAAQWALNVALNANPVGLIVIAILALVAVVTIIIKKYDEWGAAVTLLLGPLGFVINLVQSFRKNWEFIEAAFQKKGILGGILAIGKAILDAIIYPFQQLLEWIGKIPGINIATTGAEKLEEFRQGLFTAERELVGKPVMTTQASAAQDQIKREEKTEKSVAELFIKGEGNQAFDLNIPAGFPVQVTPTN